MNKQQPLRPVVIAFNILVEMLISIFVDQFVRPWAGDVGGDFIEGLAHFLVGKYVLPQLPRLKRKLRKRYMKLVRKWRSVLPTGVGQGKREA